MSLSRRRFIHEVSALTASALALPPLVQQPMLSLAPAAGGPVRIRGRVILERKAVARAAVSDGRQVVTTDRSGYFELLADRESRFVQLSLPSGCEVPTLPSGAANLFRPIRA